MRNVFETRGLVEYEGFSVTVKCLSCWFYGIVFVRGEIKYRIYITIIIVIVIVIIIILFIGINILIIVIVIIIKKIQFYTDT